jgi:hypothetical protein
VQLHDSPTALTGDRRESMPFTRLSGVYSVTVSWESVGVLDDVGLKPLHPPSPEDLYDIINERYEKASVRLISNRDPSE